MKSGLRDKNWEACFSQVKTLQARPFSDQLDIPQCPLLMKDEVLLALASSVALMLAGYSLDLDYCCMHVLSSHVLGLEPLLTESLSSKTSRDSG